MQDRKRHRLPLDRLIGRPRIGEQLGLLKTTKRADESMVILLTASGHEVLASVAKPPA